MPRVATIASGSGVHSGFAQLEQRLLASRSAIEDWFHREWSSRTPPFYTSVDLRNAGFKLAPVDTNLYPGGYNNLTPAMLRRAALAATSAMERRHAGASKLLLIPEMHTRNAFYLMNVRRLVEVLTAAGLDVRLGSLDPSLAAAAQLQVPDGSTLTIEPLCRDARRLRLEDFEPDAILLNNDLSAGIPAILEDLDEQCVLPPLYAGWAVRRKTRHFAAYRKVSRKFAELLGVDSWLIDPLFEGCDSVNFQDGTGRERIQDHVSAMLGEIRDKYDEYGIEDRPFVIVKADAGTYGMGVLTVHDSKELDGLNRKTRNKMSVIKDGQEVSEVILQEGVPTSERVKGAAAEQVLYLIDRYIVGGFYRVHPDRGIDQNLNSPGAMYVPLLLPGEGAPVKDGREPSWDLADHQYTNGVIARLAMLAASYELDAAPLP